MGKGIHKSWTPSSEDRAQQLIDGCRSFAEKHLIMTLRDFIKYDQRTKEGKRSQALARLRLATATDEDLEEMAKLRVKLLGEDNAGTVAEALEELKKARALVREKGFKKGELVCL